MSAPNLRIIASPAELRGERAQWDRLWQATGDVSPTLRAELLALEAEHFYPRARLRLIVVEQAGEFVAALPLVERGGAPGWRLGSLFGNCWSPSADLLLDPAADADSSLSLLIAGLCATRWPLVDLHALDLARPRWRRFRQALDAAGVRYRQRPRGEIGRLRIAGDWSRYLASLSRNHRRQMRRRETHAERMGRVELRVRRNLAPQDVEGWLRRGFEVEDRNWKGKNGSSVLRSFGKFAFLLGQAREFAAQGCLHLAFLERDGTPIAFEYGWTNQGVYYCFKVGYDAAFAEYSPGQLLRWRLYEQLFDEGVWRAIDYLGPVTRAVGAWSNDSYTVRRLLIAPGRLSGRLALAAYDRLRPPLDREPSSDDAEEESAQQEDSPRELQPAGL